MEVAVLANDREVRSRLVSGAALLGATAREYATAAVALDDLSSRPFGLIVLDWRVYPGFGSSDPAIQELAQMLPDARHNESLLYWQVMLRVIERIRAPESKNAGTMILLRIPAVPQTYAFGMEDDLSREMVETDLKKKAPVEVLYGASLSDFTNAVIRVLGTSA